MRMLLLLLRNAETVYGERKPAEQGWKTALELEMASKDVLPGWKFCVHFYLYTEIKKPLKTKKTEKHI